jgi:rod shape-determining protein MreD
MGTIRHVALLGLGLVLILVQENFFRLSEPVSRLLAWAGVPAEYCTWPGFVPSFTLPLILFMGVREYALVKGAGISFVLGYVTDLVGIAPIGLYTFTFVALFTVARAAGLRLAAQTRWMQLLLTLGFAAVHSAMVLVLLSIFGVGSWVPKAVFKMAFPHILATALIGPLMFKLSARVEGAAERSSSSNREAGA